MIGKASRAFFKIAKNISTLSDHPRHKLGAVVVDKHRVISTGYNSLIKCHPLQAKIDTERFGVDCPGCVHAETSCLLPLIRDKVDLSNASIYVYREHKNGIPALAKPCPGCQSLIRSCGIRKVYYSTEDGYAEEKW